MKEFISPKFRASSASLQVTRQGDELLLVQCRAHELVDATLIYTQKTLALIGLMKKYQPEGGYEPISSEMRVLDAVAVIKIITKTLRGKYKIGQHLSHSDKMDLAKKILKKNSPTAKNTLKIMGFEITANGLKMIDEPTW